MIEVDNEPPGAASAARRLFEQKMNANETDRG